jgi:hypothetical protein
LSAEVDKKDSQACSCFMESIFCKGGNKQKSSTYQRLGAKRFKCNVLFNKEILST